MRSVSVKIRRAFRRDATSIAKVHVQSWHETYKNLLPFNLINQSSIYDRTMMWERILTTSDRWPNTTVFVAETDSNCIVGFGACSYQRSEDHRIKGFCGEFQSIYVLREYQRNRIGKLLMKTMLTELQERNISSASIWVLRENQSARKFFEVLDGQLIDERIEYSRTGDLLHEVAYGWIQLDVIS